MPTGGGCGVQRQGGGRLKADDNATVLPEEVVYGKYHSSELPDPNIMRANKLFLFTPSGAPRRL